MFCSSPKFSFLLCAGATQWGTIWCTIITAFQGGQPGGVKTVLLVQTSELSLQVGAAEVLGGREAGLGGRLRRAHGYSRQLKDGEGGGLSVPGMRSTASGTASTVCFQINHKHTALRVSQQKPRAQSLLHFVGNERILYLNKMSRASIIRWFAKKYNLS